MRTLVKMMTHNHPKAAILCKFADIDQCRAAAGDPPSEMGLVSQSKKANYLVKPLAVTHL
jgi:hypothetical protein